MQKSLLFFVFVLTVPGWMGCSRNTAPVKQSSLALRTAIQSQENSLKMLDKLSQQADSAAIKGKIATSANEEIQAYVSVERDKIETTTRQLQAASSDVDAYAKGRSEKRMADVLNEANSAVMASSEILRILEKKTEVIVDFLGSETFSKSEIGALFRPGEYHLIPEQVKEGQRLFRPIVEKLFLFAEKYKDTFQSLKGEIIVTGYSDATPVEPNSRLYRDLSQQLQSSDNVSDPTTEDLNQKLSELRAGAVKGLLESIIKTRKQPSSRLLDISVTILGRGVEIPPGLPESLAKNDRRRRIVTFYWVVLPTL